MKKFLVLCFLLITTLAANSQVLISLLLGDKVNSPNIEFGLEGGFNWTDINGFDNNSGLGNFNLGFYFDIRMKNNLFLYSGVQGISGLGMGDLSASDLEFLDAEIYDVEGTYDQRISSFMVPILANYKFDNHFYVEVGPQVGLIYKGWVEFNSDKNNKDWKIKEYNDNQLNWLNAGIAVGTGYKLMKGEGWTIGIRYYQGLTDVFKYKSGSIHHSLHFKVNIPIGVAKPDDGAS
ncbi:porin family protein [uncultured Draconibacterium sp.]|uniref:porin family protein n=1 Tax=uncultured Draconibacterium sp. TaxID=1573823 RepID=UPI002AA953C2|nr:porin family protein [uncultured Draconibacterium sp.]